MVDAAAAAAAAGSNEWLEVQLSLQLCYQSALAPEQAERSPALHCFLSRHVQGPGATALLGAADSPESLWHTVELCGRVRRGTLPRTALLGLEAVCHSQNLDAVPCREGAGSGTVPLWEIAAAAAAAADSDPGGALVSKRGASTAPAPT